MEKLLLADQDPIIRWSVAEELSDSGYSALEASNTVEALHIAEQAGPIDLLITDIHLPELDGHTLANRLKSANPSLLVLVLSTRQKTQFPPATRHDAALVKPTAPRVVRATVEQLLSQKR